MRASLSFSSRSHHSFVSAWFTTIRIFVFRHQLVAVSSIARRQISVRHLKYNTHSPRSKPNDTRNEKRQKKYHNNTKVKHKNLAKKKGSPSHGEKKKRTENEPGEMNDIPLDCYESILFHFISPRWWKIHLFNMETAYDGYFCSLFFSLYVCVLTFDSAALNVPLLPNSYKIDTSIRTSHKFRIRPHK